MGEKRFQMGRRIDVVSDIYDSQNDKLLILSDVVDLLNTQQATNSALRTENNHLIDVIKEYAKKYEKQQVTIEEQNNLIEKLRWDLNKTREDLNYFANLKVMAMKGCEPNE